MQQYIDLVRHVLEFGDRKAARTGGDTISVFVGHDVVDLAEGDLARGREDKLLRGPRRGKVTTHSGGV